MPDKKSWKLPYWVIPSILLTTTVTTVGLLVAFPPRWEWLGVGESQEISQVITETIDSKTKKKTVTTIKHEQAKNLWDWFSLLGVPISVAFLGWWLQYLQQKRSEEQKAIEQQRTEEQAYLERELAETNRREEALQAYLDRISTLLIDKNLLALADPIRNAEVLPKAIRMEKELLNAAVDVIRSRTLSILRQLGNDPVRKTSVIQFLLETEIIRKLDVNLSGVNLEGVSLKDVSLKGASLENASLMGANLEGVSLEGACLIRANLEHTSLIGANLEGANLEGASLEGACLIRANLKDAELIRANLKDAYLEGASLEGANLIRARLEGVNLKDAELIRANLTHVELADTILEGANLKDAELKGTNLFKSNLKDAILIGAKSMTPDQIKQAINWEQAHYDLDFCKELGLTSEEPKQN